MENKMLEAKFHQEMLDTYYVAARKLHYRATRFLNMVNEQGGVKTAKTLLQSDEISYGLTGLYLGGCLDISVEALVLKPEYATLFTAEERAKARANLAAVHYIASWDEGK